MKGRRAFQTDDSNIEKIEKDLIAKSFNIQETGKKSLNKDQQSNDEMKIDVLVVKTEKAWVHADTDRKGVDIENIGQ